LWLFLVCYRFGGVQAGETYVFSVKHKNYQFLNNPAVRFVGEDLSDFDFTTSP